MRIVGVVLVLILVGRTELVPVGVELLTLLPMALVLAVLVLVAHPVARGIPPRSPPAFPAADPPIACCCSSSSATAQRSGSLMPPLPSASSAISTSLASEIPSPAVSDSCRTIV